MPQADGRQGMGFPQEAGTSYAIYTMGFEVDTASGNDWYALLIISPRVRIQYHHSNLPKLLFSGRDLNFAFKLTI